MNDEHRLDTEEIIVNEDALRNGMIDILKAIQTNKDAASGLSEKLTRVAEQIDSVRVEQRKDTDQLRRDLFSALEKQRTDMQAYFVARVEFIPHQTFVNTKLTEVDAKIEKNAKAIETLTVERSIAAIATQKDVEALQNDLKELQGKGSATFARVAAVIAIGFSTIATLFSVYQHIVLK